ncbi:MAG: hypothetical protein A3G32_07755 [Deltaproteobacteria bacterium RIFCSPLOWO2_12_FULL_40_28]|nr:MAG: hypothetical protein A3C45_00455 [Deltaproteobacteria bacterium RIFCSPHIGHO2_02_FULL_40_28]OGQ21025.1 MAG: hypothetical protein A3E27_03120 [Deltaproteobacteria bacterium RIFCSPHIGHO2_12_FULL_40_32]OGQ39426.1 MAG: hypothetical protein A3I69_04480 [Deltaproteobacteria bacterium RIFCSPLOWO2_02_FULL_40_36]OGQ54491.1 MAG: hypothetical protein A3G32_07755 [Deltaproteobacteria bacterium RIFCSPLOWO2_12_FULL_40_28]
MDKTKKSALSHKTLHFYDNRLTQSLYGPHESHLKIIEKKIPVILRARGNEINISGESEAIDQAFKILNKLYTLAERGQNLTEVDIERTIHLSNDISHDGEEAKEDKIIIPGRNKVIYPHTLGQREYVKTLLHHDITFGLGPAGTGKTYLAMAIGVHLILKGQVKRIVLTRPAVEAGERLGFLPGDLAEKVNPYLRPLYDALNDMLDFERTQRMLDRNEIEVAPLAFMRGRTLNECFVILDEAQNCTHEQMKMFLTRIGQQSKAVVTGDMTQTDLPLGLKPGLKHAVKILQDIPGIGVCYLTEKDVVRHPLVQQIIKAYEQHEEK